MYLKRILIAFLVFGLVFVSGCSNSYDSEPTNVHVADEDNETTQEVENNTADYNAEQEVVEQAPFSPEEAILGTWTKMTGVSYTFEADGHMSVSIASNYNASAGTTLDGLEVSGILGEIDDFGRVVRGGTWSYAGEEDGKYYYELFYNGSEHICLLEEGGPLGVILKSGMGDMSMLVR